LSNTAATSPGLPASDSTGAIRRPRGASLVKAALFIGPVAVLVAGLLLGLPAKPVSAQPLPTFAPLAPEGVAHRGESSLPLDVPFTVQFTKPMNESTVAAAFSITPAIDVRFEWDATGQVLSLAPDPYWQPHTDYTVDIFGSATDQEGLGLTTPVHASFQSGEPTAGQITVTRMVGDRASPSTAIQITFTRPVKLATVMMRLGISPQTPTSITGDDPTDLASQVFTMTPKQALLTNTTYQITFGNDATDSAGATLQPIAPVTVTTLEAPAVLKITPQDGSVVYDTHQPISVQFSVPMDQKSAAAALSVTVGGRAVAGSTAWTDDGLTLVFTSRYAFYLGSRVSVTVNKSARSAGGLTMPAGASAGFTVIAAATGKGGGGGRKIPWLGGVASATRPYHDSELYYLSLMNCTRTGGWVTSGGLCSTVTHHTLPARPALANSDGIADGAARPYAKALADAGVLTHTYGGTTVHARLAAVGFPGPSWGENIASPSNSGAGGMVSVETYFQAESWCRCGHYANIMNSYFHRAGVGVWVTSGRVRVVADFYG
jgi:hypothetical protein